MNWLVVVRETDEREARIQFDVAFFPSSSRRASGTFPPLSSKCDRSRCQFPPAVAPLYAFVALGCQLKGDKAQARRRELPICPLLLPCQKKLVERRKEKTPLSSPCRRLGAEGTACPGRQTPTSMLGQGSRLAEGAGAAGARPGGACRRP